MATLNFVNLFDGEYKEIVNRIFNYFYFKYYLELDSERENLDKWNDLCWDFIHKHRSQLENAGLTYSEINAIRDIPAKIRHSRKVMFWDKKDLKYKVHPIKRSQVDFSNGEIFIFEREEIENELLKKKYIIKDESNNIQYLNKNTIFVRTNAYAISCARVYNDFNFEEKSRQYEFSSNKYNYVLKGYIGCNRDLISGILVEVEEKEEA